MGSMGEGLGLGCSIRSGLARGGGPSPARTHGEKKYQLHSDGWGVAGRQEVRSLEASTPCTGLQCGREARWEWGTLRAGRRPHPPPHRGLCAGGGSYRPQPFPGSRLCRVSPPGTQDTVGPEGLSQRQEGLVAAASFQQAPSPGLQAAWAAYGTHCPLLRGVF